ncbi:MAG: inorganic phosphate transporter, partial [Actinomycetota bacterium]|nr:inorganic phosphate transporter [Actinomycetota bacterium]
SGVGKKDAQIRWGVAGSMVIAWVLTLPAAALVAAGIGKIVDGGGSVQIILVTVVAALGLLGVWRWSHRHPVTAENVNDYVDPADRAILDAELPVQQVLEQKAS